MRQAVNQMHKAPVTISMTLEPGPISMEWRFDSKGREAFRGTYQNETYEFRSGGQQVMELSYGDKEYVQIVRFLDEWAPPGSLTDFLSDVYPTELRPEFLAGLSKVPATKSEQDGVTQVTFRATREVVSYRISAGGQPLSVQSTKYLQDGVLKRTWTLRTVKSNCAPITLDPPSGFSPAYVPDAEFMLGPEFPIPDLPVLKSNGQKVKLSKLTGKTYTIVELLTRGQSPHPGLKKIASQMRLPLISIGPNSIWRDDGTWFRMFAQGGYPVVFLIDRHRVRHLAFQGEMPQMTSDLTAYLTHP